MRTEFYTELSVRRLLALVSEIKILVFQKNVNTLIKSAGIMGSESEVPMVRGGAREGAGRPAMGPDEKAKPFQIKIPPTLLDQIKARASIEGVNATQLIIKSVRRYLEDHNAGAC